MYVFEIAGIIVSFATNTMDCDCYGLDDNSMIALY